MVKEIVVIIPTLNEERFISKCIDSVMNQSFPFVKMEILVVDGGSNDKTCEIINNLSVINHNIRLLENPMKIQSAAFNIGVANSTAPIIIRLDAHAEYDSHYIEYCVENLKNEECLGNTGGRCAVRPHGGGLTAHANAILNGMKFAIGGASFRVSMNKSYTDSVPFGAFRRSIVEKVGAMNESLPRGEDNEYNYRIRQNGFKVLFDPRIVATYFARDTFVGSVKQMYANGFSIGVLLNICPNSIGVRHFIPFVFLLSLLLMSVLSLFSFYALLALILELILYSIVNIAASFVAAIKVLPKAFLVLPILIFAVHISYGYGTLIGLFRKKY